MNLKRLCLTAAMTSIALLVSACGGSDDNSTPPVVDNRTPEQRENEAASASIGGLVAFVLAQINGATSESTEPRAIDGINPPASESEEPIVI